MWDIQEDLVDITTISNNSVNKLNFTKNAADQVSRVCNAHQHYIIVLLE